MRPSHCIFVLLLVACAPASPPPILERSPVLEAASTYRVRQGDSLYSIAWRHGLDYKVLAKANRIEPPYGIDVGQELRLSETAQARDAAPRGTPQGGSRPRPSPSRRTRLNGWSWPVDAAPKRGFGGISKGLDYMLAPGTEIRASASGEVVYAGHGVGGFRHLVIIRHGAAYLSAYGMNVAPTVVEGQRVSSGARLAEIENERGSDRRMHFEIRRDGKPLDPREVIGS